MGSSNPPGQPGGPAGRAGITAGDVIMSVGGQRVSSSIALAGVLATLKPGATVSVDITKPGGSQSTVHIELGQYPGAHP